MQTGSSVLMILMCKLVMCMLCSCRVHVVFDLYDDVKNNLTHFLANFIYHFMISRVIAALSTAICCCCSSTTPARCSRNKHFSMRQVGPVAVPHATVLDDCVCGSHIDYMWVTYRLYVDGVYVVCMHIPSVAHAVNISAITDYNCACCIFRLGEVEH